MHSQLMLTQLRVMKQGKPLYDQRFHEGVNIIRGENGTGKSTVSDFIFFILGGEFDDWKEVAGACEEVQAEIKTANGLITLRRAIGKRNIPIQIFFGTMIEAAKEALDTWRTVSLQRTPSAESFSQILFRAIGIPEAQSQGASNITMHQILRLMYGDQRTPAPRLFRFESFDTKEIREAVGELLCGINRYDYYEAQLLLRDLDKQFQKKVNELALLWAAMPREEGLTNTSMLSKRLAELDNERVHIINDIENVDERMEGKNNKDFLMQRDKSLKRMNIRREAVYQLERQVNQLTLELDDLREYEGFLQELSNKLVQTEATSEYIGSIDFTHCPGCLQALPARDALHCCVCGSETKLEADKSKYLQIRTDLALQLRENDQLLEEKSSRLSRVRDELRAEKRLYEELLNDFTIHYDVSNSPREAFLAERNNRLGQMERERSYLFKLFDTAKEIDIASTQKDEIQRLITSTKERMERLNYQGDKQRTKALGKISDEGVAILHQDTKRQDELMTAKALTLNFADDAIFVDGKMNFAESSNVIVKNSTLLAFLSAAANDVSFYHPRFLLLDNVEDKGMEPERSQHFQELVVRTSQAATLPHQIIFTTSGINPSLETEEYVIGPKYTHENRTLRMLVDAGSIKPDPTLTKDDGADLA